MYNETFPCNFEPKSKVLADSISVYQLLSATRVGKKKDNTLKFLVTEKIHATLLPKNVFQCLSIIFFNKKSKLESN